VTTGVLLVNSGTPASTHVRDVRRFLSAFLYDPRVVELPRAVWVPILQGVVLRTRPQASAKKYRKIWMPEGSPLWVYSQALRTALAARLGGEDGGTRVALGMLYSEPSVGAGIESLMSAGVDRIVALPLFPQYSGAASGSAFEAVAAALKRQRVVPALRFVPSYYSRADFVAAWRERIESTWRTVGRSRHLLFSFHGVPQANIDRGDVYLRQCQETAAAIAASLNLAREDWTISFQSRVGVARWLQPYTFDVMAELPKKGITDLAVACPGFALDCLETLEEIDIENRRRFLESGGQRFVYVPALNASAPHVEMLAALIREETQGWGPAESA
jgi:ferrochelatase